MQSKKSTTFHTKQNYHFSLLFPELEPLEVSDAQLKKLSTTMVERRKSKIDSEVISNGLSIFSQRF